MGERMKIGYKMILMVFSYFFWMYGLAIFSGSYFPQGINHTSQLHFFLAEFGMLFTLFYSIFYWIELRSPTNMFELFRWLVKQKEAKQE